MNIEERIAELEEQQQALIRRQQEDTINIHRLAGAIAILREQLQGQEEPAHASKNGKVQEPVG